MYRSRNETGKVEGKVNVPRKGCTVCSTKYTQSGCGKYGGPEHIHYGENESNFVLTLFDKQK